jgi:hypothetical protein
MLAHHFSHYYSRRCRQMMPEATDVIRPSCPRSHQTFHPVPTVKLLGIMLRNRCWPTIFHTMAAGRSRRCQTDWCQKRPGVISASLNIVVGSSRASSVHHWLCFQERPHHRYPFFNLLSRLECCAVHAVCCAVQTFVSFLVVRIDGLPSSVPGGSCCRPLQLCWGIQHPDSHSKWLHTIRPVNVRLVNNALNPTASIDRHRTQIQWRWHERASKLVRIPQSLSHWVETG